MNKKQLAIRLSKLKTFSEPKISLEQYQTESEIAAEILWWAFLEGDVEDKVVADLGCGNGIFGYGALLLGASKVYFVDKEISLAKNNVKGKKAVFVESDVKDFNEKVDVIFQNPPFGTKKKHADKEFLEKAMLISDVIYSFHKIESDKMISKLAEKNDFRINAIFKFNMRLKRTYQHHVKNKYGVKVGCWYLKRK